jgi:hypothetical protein
VIPGRKHTGPELATKKRLKKLRRISPNDPDQLPRELELIDALRQRQSCPRRVNSGFMLTQPVERFSFFRTMAPTMDGRVMPHLKAFLLSLSVTRHRAVPLTNLFGLGSAAPPHGKI